MLVHVDVGTAALGQGLQNASSGKAPILIFAGQAPFTLYGELAGSRSEHVQWYQDIRNQNSILAPYSRYTNEIKSAAHVEIMVNRALLMASTGPPGPVYLTATREVLAAQTQPSLHKIGSFPRPVCHLGGLPPEGVEAIGNALMEAAKPLAVTVYLGRNHNAVTNLIALANHVRGLRVFDSEYREMSFPANHPAWITRATGAGKLIKEADVIIVLDSDVPWIPTKVKPSASAKIYHIDLDPRKEQMNLFDIHATSTYHASCAVALGQLVSFISQSPLLRQNESEFAQRWNSMLQSHHRGLENLSSCATAHPSGRLTKELLFRSLRLMLPEDTIFVSDAVTNQVALSEQLQLSVPGTNLTKGASGLGWAGGAAIGVKLATQLYKIEDRPKISRIGHSETNTAERFICMIIGDGAFTFGSPTAVYQAAHRLCLPFLTIVLNNRGWKATRSCLNDVHPDGVAVKLTDKELGIDLELDGPDYGGIAKAASAGRLWTRQVTWAQELETAIGDARRTVEQDKRGALLDAVIL